MVICNTEYSALSTPWEEEEKRRTEEQQAREAKQAAMNLVSGLGIHPELVEIKHAGTVIPAKNWDYGVNPDELVGIPDACDDDALMRDLVAHYEEIELWVGFPCEPMPGPSIEWVGLLKTFATHPGIRFPESLAERLRPWIPQKMWDLVVAK